MFLKALDRFGNCQRPLFSLKVSHRTYASSNICEDLGSIDHRSCKTMMEEKTPLCTNLSRMPEKSFFDSNIFLRKLPFSKLHYFRGSNFSRVCIHVYYNQQPSVACYQVRVVCNYMYSTLYMVIVLSNYQTCPVPLYNWPKPWQEIHLFSNILKSSRVFLLHSHKKKKWVHKTSMTKEKRCSIF